MIIERKQGKTLYFSTEIKTDEGEQICSLYGEVSKTNPLGSTSIYVSNDEKFAENAIEISREYSKFKAMVEEKVLKEFKN